ncbi:MAG: hypothetical protein KJP12_07640 [Acidimicrobiia bacterium]|nr:hypothetical protein [Acidimicrobiia bacterium]
MRIDEFLPVYDFANSHELEIDAPPTAVRRALLEVNLTDDVIVRTLFRLRGLPRRSTTWAGLEQLGFVRLANDPGELLFGLIGRFWTVTGGLVEIDAAHFAEYAEPGYAKTAWNFTIEPAGTGTLLGTRTRVVCTDDSARTRFRRYWRVVGPFSGVIRRRMLKLVKRGLDG